MSDLIDRQMLKADLLCGDNTEHDYCFPCKEILERIDNQPAAETHDKRTETRACDLIDRRALMKEFSDFVRASNNSDFAPTPTWNDAVSLVGSMPSAQSTIGQQNDGDTISRRMAIDALLKEFERDTPKAIRAKLTLEDLPSAQPERTCVNCGRTVNNGGWYADGRTRCPIEEHYALPKDGYCHLWEKRNVTDDDYPERRTDE